VALLQDRNLRDTVYPGDDASLSLLLLRLQQFATSEFAKFGGGWPYTAAPIRAFLEQNA